MANDVSIIVSAELGDTLIKLDMAKHAVNELGDSAEKAAVKQDAAAASTGFFSGMIATLSTALGTNIPLLFGFSAPLAALPAIAAVAAAAISALATALGTLVAIVADLVAPLTLVAGLLGSLGLGFVLAGQRAAHGGGALQIFADKLATLHSMFSRTTDILAHAFLPYLLQLADAAKQALLFIDKLAREPLAKAMHDMATQGVQMLNKFVESVAHVLAKPIRLAFQIAFGSGPGGNEFATVVSHWWNQLRDFLFGYTQTHRMNLPLEKQFAPITKTHVDGIFQPLIDWFNRHHFTRQGHEIGQGILNGITSSGAAQRIGQFLISVIGAAFKSVFTTAMRWWGELNHAFNQDLQQWHNEITAWVEAPFISAWHSIESAAVSTLSTIWGWLQRIAGFFHQAFTLHVNLPSLPSSIHIPGTGTSIPLPWTAGGGGGSGALSFHFHADGRSSPAAERASFSRFSRQVGAELARQQHLLAGGN